MRRFRARFFILLCFCLLAFHGSSWSSEAPVAVLTGFEGEVSVWREGSEKQAEAAMSLYSGSEVHTGQGASAYILFVDNEVKVLEENARYRIELTRGPEDAAALPGLPEPRQAMEQFKYLLVSSNYGLGAAGHEEQLVYPGSRIANPRPAFVWEPPSEGAPEKVSLEHSTYRLQLFDQQGKNILTAEDVSSPFPYPEAGPSLEFRKTYRWKLTRVVPKGESREFVQTFSLVDRQRCDELEDRIRGRLKPGADMATSLYMKGAVMKELGLYADAALVYREYWRLFPDARFPALELALCYREMGLEDLAGRIAGRFVGASGDVP